MREIPTDEALAYLRIKLAIESDPSKEEEIKANYSEFFYNWLHDKVEIDLTEQALVEMSEKMASIVVEDAKRTKAFVFEPGELFTGSVV